tara:strand:- start:32824 stop:33210 length:387 start_codon:yes stop_codon:yes gene_type:complete
LIFTRPIGGALVDQKLDEGTLFGRQFPGCGFLARTQADDRPSDADRLTGPQFEIPGKAVTFVQETECGDALRHRCSDLIGHRCDQIIIARRSRLGFFGCLAGCIFLDIIAAEPATAGQQDRCQNREQY